MPNPTAAMLVIGDEILSGRTHDTNTHYLAKALTSHGVRLTEVRVVADDQSAIIAAVNALRAGVDHVFTSGGIGPTHDDITAVSIAAAFGVAITHRADAMALLAAHYEKVGHPFNEARQRMARIPDGATLIDNPVSTAPGFTLGNVHVMAGVPNIFQAMVASVLPMLTGARPCSATVSVCSVVRATSRGPLGILRPDILTSRWDLIRSSVMVSKAQTLWCVARIRR